MRIHFPILLYWLIPELRGLSATAVQHLIEMARPASRQRIRQYAGWCFVVSLLAPLFILGPAFLRCNPVAWEHRIALGGILGLLSSLLSSLLISLFYGLILRPAIRSLLRARNDFS